jgi:Arc/MetJ-type ribon-helix-helix transcriptional regulator
MTEKPIYVTAKVPPQLKQEIADEVKTGKFMNESDLIRQAIRSLLNDSKEVN